MDLRRAEYSDPWDHSPGQSQSCLDAAQHPPRGSGEGAPVWFCGYDDHLERCDLLLAIRPAGDQTEWRSDSVAALVPVLWILYGPGAQALVGVRCKRPLLVSQSADGRGVVQDLPTVRAELLQDQDPPLS